jgi:hypothetical protein
MRALRLIAGGVALAAAFAALPASAQIAPTASQIAPHSPEVVAAVSTVTVMPVPYEKQLTSKRTCFTGWAGAGGDPGSVDDTCVQEVIDDLIALRHAPGYAEQFQRALATCLAWGVEFFNSTAAVRTQEGDLTTPTRVEDNHPKMIQACGRARKADDSDKAAQRTAGQGPTFAVVRKPDLAFDPALDGALEAIKGKAGAVTLNCEASGGSGDIRNCREAPGPAADPALTKAAMQLAATYRVETTEGSAKPDPNQIYVVPVPFRFEAAK